MTEKYIWYPVLQKCPHTLFYLADISVVFYQKKCLESRAPTAICDSTVEQYLQNERSKRSQRPKRQRSSQRLGEQRGFEGQEWTLFHWCQPAARLEQL
jgi:hypothetical protein